MRIMGEMGNSAALKALKWQAFHGSLARRLAIRTLMFAVVISMLPLMQLVYDVDPTKPLFLSADECEPSVGYLGPNSFLGRVLKPVTPIAFPHLRSGVCHENVNLTIDVVRELVGKNLLNFGGKALCVGQGSTSTLQALQEMGFSDVDAIQGHPFFKLKQRQVIFELDFDDNLFEFVITRDLSKVSIPAIFINEVERVLKAGGVGAMLVNIEGSGHDGLIRSATSVSSFLKSSDVVHVAGLGTFTLVAFKKRANEFGSFLHYQLPTNCPSIKRNKPFINNIEPLVVKKPKVDDRRIAYLPSFVDVTSKGKLVYVDMGVKAVANFSDSNWFLPSYPIDSRAFSISIVDDNALVISSHVKSPGVTFIYHPALDPSVAKEKVSLFSDEEPFVSEEEFDFFIWFKENVEFADFVVLKMNVGKAEMKFLSELFESGAICLVDELFLQCSGSDYGGRGGVGESCLNIVKDLRSIGVFAHQWWGN